MMMIWALGALACVVGFPSTNCRRGGAEDAGPVALRPDGPVRDWVVLGPLPNPRHSSNPREGFDTDYLAPLGGEVEARLRDGAELPGHPGVSVQTAKQEGPTLDFRSLWSPSDNQLAYAYAEVKASADCEAVFLFGSDDGAKVWVNGELVHEVFPPDGRALTARSEEFTARLHRGVNRILVKVENGTGDWAVALEIYGPEEAARIQAERERKARILDLQGQEVGPAASWGGYVFTPEAGFPRIVWRDADRVRELNGDTPLSARWFDGDLNEVTKPEEPGRYIALVEAPLRNGTTYRRSLTFYCAPEGTDFWWRFDTIAAPFPAAGIDPKVWEERRDKVGRWAAVAYNMGLTSSEPGAMLLAWLSEQTPGAVTGPLDSPDVRASDVNLALRRRLAGLPPKGEALAPPRALSGAKAPVLHEGQTSEAGVASDAKERIDAVARKWAEESGEPFALLVARRGVVITHEAFGAFEDGTPIGTDFRFEVASITKALTGMLFSRFVDQGLLGLDQPIGEVLPGFPTSGPKALTFRHLFTHTSGLEGHAMWGGIDNVYLDSAVLNGLEALEPGTVHIYNGMGYDLAGQAMESVTGASIRRLMAEGLFAELGLDDVPPVDDLGFGAKLTAWDLGVLGQCLANRGCYGSKRLVSEKTFEDTLPVPLSDYWPGIAPEWGIGLTPYTEMRTLDPDAPSQEPQRIFEGLVIGHGSATSCVLRVVLDDGLVIAQIRRTAGPKYDERLRELLTTIADSVER